MIEHLLPYLTLTASSLFALFIVGACIMGFFQPRGKNGIENTWKVLFRNLVAAITFLSVAQAIFKTNGNTVFILILPLLGYYFRHHKIFPTFPGFKSKLLTEIKLCFTPEFLFLIAFAIYFSYQYFNSIYVADFGLYSFPGDNNFYARLSTFISLTGKENHNINLLVKGASPYHYYELWFNALLTEISRLKSYFVFFIVTIPILISVLLAGIWALLYQLDFLNLRSRPVLIIIIGIALLHFHGFYLDVLEKVHPVFTSLNTFTVPLIFSKLIPVSIFLVAATLYFLQERKTEGFLIFLFIPIVTIATALAIFGAATLWLLFMAFFTRQKGRFLRLIYLAGYIILLGLFYVINTQINKLHGYSPFSSMVNLETIISNFTDPAFLKTCFNILAGTLVTLPFLYLPLLILAFFRPSDLKKFYRLRKELIWFYLMLNFIPLVMWAALHRVLDSVQVFQIIFIPTTFLLVLLFINFVWQQISTGLPGRFLAAKKVFIVILICFPVFEPGFFTAGVSGQSIPVQYSFSYLDKVRDYFTARPAKVITQGVLLNNVSGLKDVFTKNINIQWPGAAYIPTFSNNVLLTSLTIMDIPRTSDTLSVLYSVEDIYIKTAPFHDFCLKQNLLKAYRENKTDVQLTYIAAHPELEFVIVDPEYRDIIKRLTYKAIFVDPATQQTFIVLR